MINWGMFKIRAAKAFSVMGLMTLVIAILVPDNIWGWTTLLGAILYLEAWCIGWQVSDKEMEEYEEYMRKDNNDIGPYRPV